MMDELSDQLGDKLDTFVEDTAGVAQANIDGGNAAPVVADTAPAGQVLGAARAYKAPSVSDSKKDDTEKKTDDPAKKVVADKNTKKEKTENKKATITDEGVALAAGIPVEETNRFNFWWLFLLLLLAAGVNTEEMVRNHYKKMNEENQDK